VETPVTVNPPRDEPGFVVSCVFKVFPADIPLEPLILTLTTAPAALDTLRRSMIVSGLDTSRSISDGSMPVAAAIDAIILATSSPEKSSTVASTASNSVAASGVGAGVGTRVGDGVGGVVTVATKPAASMS
jgi:hypothetical protein